MTGKHRLPVDPFANAICMYRAGKPEELVGTRKAQYDLAVVILHNPVYRRTLDEASDRVETSFSQYQIWCEEHQDASDAYEDVLEAISYGVGCRMHRRKGGGYEVQCSDGVWFEVKL